MTQERNEAQELQELTADTAPDEKNEKPKKTWQQELIEWMKALVFALVFVVIIRSFFFTIIRVDGNSMNNTLFNNERLFVTVLDVKLKGVERGDVVICHYPNRGNTFFVKRAVGVPGDVVRREKGVTYVNGEPLDPKGILYEYMYDYDEYTLGENEYFCVGDNRYDSHDSRDWNDGDPSWDVGPVSGELIVGKVREVIWPLNAIRGVK